MIKDPKLNTIKTVAFKVHNINDILDYLRQTTAGFLYSQYFYLMAGNRICWINKTTEVWSDECLPQTITKLTCDPLILTPYIRKHQISEAKSLSRVTGLPNAPTFESYSGFLTVDDRFNSNMFFWFFPSFKNPKTSPVVVWLEGGPGISSLFSLFTFGPLVVDQMLNVTTTPSSWAQEVSILYIDNPVGTGYSFTDNAKGYSTNENMIADNLYEALQQFYTVFAEYRGNGVYITGQSYGGHYVPALGYK
ncbi:unnamed protein product, partial [Oppiella nova]